MLFQGGPLYIITKTNSKKHHLIYIRRIEDIAGLYKALHSQSPQYVTATMLVELEQKNLINYCCLCFSRDWLQVINMLVLKQVLDPIKYT